MSWHHEDYVSLIAAIGGLVSAVSAAYAARQSRQSAKESRLQQHEIARFERERHLYELLTADSVRANDNAKQAFPRELSFAQASNIAQALDSARHRIRDFTDADMDAAPEKYIKYFRQHLTEEVNSYLTDMAPSAIDKRDPSIEQIEAHSLWTTNRRYFSFRYVEDEDLSDEDEE
ncbi:hypothetical protein MZUP3_340 [Erwinia phage vB_EhrS_49]|uniref:Uncharacterized protein n=1 Tax=Erwinia phage vB_EhrS_49 TaxID=2283026 RepID=A0A4Y1NR29_9CAUD|nr:hypothetical protein HOV54_gp34 [Erwinia phage vB_EhrS_49]AXH43453.1 hypothetical protein MZUP3_340 [Erwinia phage vB_EhrS_49]